MINIHFTFIHQYTCSTSSTSNIEESQNLVSGSRNYGTVEDVQLNDISDGNGGEVVNDPPTGNGQQNEIDKNRCFKVCCMAATALILLSFITTGILVARLALEPKCVDPPDSDNNSYSGGAVHVVPDCSDAGGTISTVYVILDCTNQSNAINDTAHNATNGTVPSCPAFCSKDSFDRLSIIVYMVWSFLHSLIYASFFRDLYVNWDRIPKIQKWKISKRWILFTVIFGVIYLTLSVATPVMGARADTIYSTECAVGTQNYSGSADTGRLIIIINAITTGAIHMVGFPIRFSTVIATLAVKSICKPPGSDSAEAAQAQAQQTQAGSGSAEEERVRKLVNKYVESGEKIKPILQIFQAWFVLQWIVYFLMIFVGITNIVMAYLQNIQHEYAFMEYVFNSLNVAISLVAFSIPYACGNKMNSYHKEYIDTMRETCIKRDGKQFKEVKLESWIKIGHSKMEDYDFVPRVWGLSIPLDNSGYTLTVFISIFGLVSTFLASPPKPSCTCIQDIFAPYSV